MATSLPLVTYFSIISAVFPQAMTLCHWVSVTFSPLLFLLLSLIAMVNLAIRFPDSKLMISGSFPKLPINCTLFLIALIILNFNVKQLILSILFFSIRQRCNCFQKVFG